MVLKNDACRTPMPAGRSMLNNVQQIVETLFLVFLPKQTLYTQNLRKRLKSKGQFLKEGGGVFYIHPAPKNNHQMYGVWDGAPHDKIYIYIYIYQKCNRPNATYAVCISVIFNLQSPRATKFSSFLQSN